MVISMYCEIDETDYLKLRRLACNLGVDFEQLVRGIIATAAKEQEALDA